ncbi:hypothetical protein F0U60_19225 [Archangium minus]|uniref:Acetoacetate decarboxylase n=2 Tax=Archangiaceae TaxID=39 RepID=A0ABY9WU81_9BACT|nr:hypothetical protein F0U60_19225 [Archangium minus]
MAFSNPTPWVRRICPSYENEITALLQKSRSKHGVKGNPEVLEIRLLLGMLAPLTAVLAAARPRPPRRTQQGDELMSADAVKTAAEEQSYPPTPWPLVGQMYSSIWLVPADRCSFAVVHPELSPIKVAGHVVVMMGFVDYQQGSMMTYRELFANVMVRHTSGLSGSKVDQIWVDEPRSLRGGRELWGIPKQLARLELNHQAPGGGFSGKAWDEKGTLLLEARYSSGLGLPRRMKVSVPTVQPLRGQVTTTDASVDCELRLVKATCNVPADSPLAALGVANRRPLMSIWMKDLRTELGAAKPVR